MAEISPAIPKGSWVLVTGATGFVASHKVKQFLERGYKVRGTVRDLQKASWLVDDVFKSYADRGEFVLVHVPDLAADHAFDIAVKGVSAIAHIAALMTFDADPNNVIPQTIAGVTSILEAAILEPSVKGFVSTSSIAAAAMPLPGIDTHVERETWNEGAVKLAWSPLPHGAGHGFVVYAASKTIAEQAVWKFVEERKPHFNVNSVNPSSILGKPLYKSHAESIGSFIGQIYNEDTRMLAGLPAIFSVDVQDVAAVIDIDVKNARLQAWAQPCHWNDILAILRRLDPEHDFIQDLPNLSRLSLSTDVSEPLALIKKWSNQDGWKSLEQTVEENMRPVAAWAAKS